MKVTAKRTLRNGFDQVLFVAGKQYEAEEVNNRYYLILNELHSETLVRKTNLEKDFEV